MKAIFAIVLISCVCAVAYSQFACLTRATEVAACITRLGNATPGNGTADFCRECGNSLVGYYQDCANGVGVDGVKASKLKITAN